MGNESIQACISIRLTIRDKPASPSRDEDIKLEGCGRMRPGLQFCHPTCQKHIKLLCSAPQRISSQVYCFTCWWSMNISSFEKQQQQWIKQANLIGRMMRMVVKRTYHFLLRAQSNPGTPLQCAPLPRGGVPPSIESTAADGCLKIYVGVMRNVCVA